VNLAYIFKMLHVTTRITVFVATAILKHEYLIKTQFIFCDEYIYKILYLSVYDSYFYSIKINCLNIQYKRVKY
jgi:hypothetical protein